MELLNLKGYIRWTLFTGTLWVAEFKRFRTNLVDNVFSGWPKTATTTK